MNSQPQYFFCASNLIKFASFFSNFPVKAFKPDSDKMSPVRNVGFRVYCLGLIRQAQECFLSTIFDRSLAPMKSA